MHFKENHKLTLIFVNNMTETTQRREIRLTRVVNGRQAYTVRRQRSKEYFLDIKPDQLVFEGWGLPVSLDSDTRSYKANGSINFDTDKPAILKGYIQAKNINEKFDRWGQIMHVHPYDDNRVYKPLY